MIINIILEFLKGHWIELLGILLSYFGIILPIYQYLSQKKIEERDKRFITFHRLVKEFVEPDSQTEKLYLDRQIAIAYEFRNFPEYYEVISRMLKDLKNQWTTSNNSKTQRLLVEMDLTLMYINDKRTFILMRIFKKLK
jgi:hypothetical protein